MNQKELAIRRNNVARRIKHTSSIHRNYIQLHPQNSKEHEMKKVEICWNLLQKDKEFITEAEFRDKNVRADIVVLDDKKIIEIESSDYKLEERKKHYPEDFELQIVKL